MGFKEKLFLKGNFEKAPLIENSSKLDAPSKQREGLNLVLVSTTVMKWKHINVELIHEWRELLI